jgi:hypothetical protein
MGDPSGASSVAGRPGWRHGPWPTRHRLPRAVRVLHAGGMHDEAGETPRQGGEDVAPAFPRASCRPRGRIPPLSPVFTPWPSIPGRRARPPLTRALDESVADRPPRAAGAPVADVALHGCLRGAGILRQHARLAAPSRPCRGRRSPRAPLRRGQPIRRGGGGRARSPPIPGSVGSPARRSPRTPPSAVATDATHGPPRIA